MTGIIFRIVRALYRATYKKAFEAIQKRNRDRINRKLRARLKNHTPSIICDNCNGGIIYHDLGLRFYSPTINLYILPDDYLKFLKRLKYYLSLELTETFEEGKDCPIGMLDDVKIYFLHYASFAEAKAKWEERAKRVDFDNLFVLMTFRACDHCTEGHIRAFEELDYKNKVFFVHKPYPQYPSAFAFSGFENDGGVPILLAFKKPTIFARRYIDEFDVVSFLNRENGNGETPTTKIS